MTHTLRILTATLLLSMGISVAHGAAPAGYYNSLDGKSEAELKAAVRNIVYKFTTVSYQSLPQYFQKTDVYPSSKRWWDMYSDIPLYAPSFAGLHREHSFPKSWWGGLETTTAYVDLNHLYPAEGQANMAKSNFPLGEVDRNSSIKFQNGITTVGYPVAGQGGGCASVFEPADEYKGDFARTYFYMVTTYSNLTWATKYMYMLQQNAYPTLNQWSVNLLLKWHRNDPVSQKELDRNEQVYKIQNNRNPFIDHPELAEYIWGNKRGEAFKGGGGGTTPTGDPDLFTPVQDMTLDFGQTAINNTSVSKLLFKGENLKGTIGVKIRPTVGNPDMFSVAVNNFDASLANAQDGYEINVTYKPTALGEHTARILITVDGIAGSRGIELRGECLAVPTLDACTATQPSDITDSTYVANWTYPEANVVDYWVVTRTKYVGSQAITEELPAEETKLLIEGFNESDYESYSLQSVRLGYRSPKSNTITVNHAGITGVEYTAPLAVVGLEGAVRFYCPNPHTDVMFFDVTGRLIKIVDMVEHNTDVAMPQGIYFIRTNEHPTSVKVIVR